jgi:hypothetical protein
MAFSTKKPAQQVSAQTQSGGRQPSYVIRAKVRDDGPNGPVWITIGAMWPAQLAGGKSGWSIKINTQPSGWNGDALAMEPLAVKE